MVCDIHFRMPWRPGVLQIQVSSLKFLFIFFIAFFDENNHQVKIGAFLLFDDLFWGVKTSGMKNNYEIIRFGRHWIQNTHTPYREIVSLSQNSKLFFFHICYFNPLKGKIHFILYELLASTFDRDLLSSRSKDEA